MIRKNISLKLFLTIAITALFYFHTLAQNWDIPANKSDKNSYIPFTDETSKSGEAIYTKNCQSCHGDPAKGNSLKSLKPIPPDLAEKQTQDRTDGDLFYILTTGRLVMPSFKNILQEEDRWKVISFIRSFNKKYVQVLSKTDPTRSKLVKITMEFDTISYKVKVTAVAEEKTGVVPLKDDEINLFATRYFGKLQIDKTVRTNSEGVAIFSFPKDLPGDKSGIVGLVANISDDIYGEVEFQQKLKVGIPTDKPSLTEKRAIWNVLTKAPIWIIVTFTSIVLAVAAILLYILFTLVKLKKLGNAKE
ncbi:MAG: cytochrome c [Bacteroidota bacterium]